MPAHACPCLPMPAQAHDIVEDFAVVEYLSHYHM
jgi:hypothetical protein